MVVSKGKNVVDQDQSYAISASTSKENSPNITEGGDQPVQLDSDIILGEEGPDIPMAAPSNITQSGPKP